jgi:hypothetical protein
MAHETFVWFHIHVRIIVFGPPSICLLLTEQWCSGAVLINLGSIVQGVDSEDQAPEAKKPQLRSYIDTAVSV